MPASVSKIKKTHSTDFQVKLNKIETNKNVSINKIFEANKNELFLYSEFKKLSLEKHIDINASVGNHMCPFLRKLGILHVTYSVAKLHER